MVQPCQVRILLVSISTAAFVMAASSVGLAQEKAPAIPGFVRFYAKDDADARLAGNLLLGELNCTSCHKSDSKAIVTKQAPILDGVSGRVKPAFLRKFIADPAKTKPGTTMPDLLHGVAQDKKAKQVEALVHYLVSLGPSEPLQEFPNVGAAERGKELFHQVGCLACHDARSPNASSLPTSVPLGDPKAKYTLPSLSAFLLDPLHVRPSGRMPNLKLSSQEARAIAAYLLELPAVANVKYHYYEGNWKKLPDFGKLKPIVTAGTSKIDVSVKKRGDRFGLRFEGYLRIDRQGKYRFFLGSDDGSRLTIDGKVIIDNDGVHAFQVKSGTADLTKGLHPVFIDFFEAGGEERLQAEIEGPGLKKQPLADLMSAVKEPPNVESLALKTDAELVRKGRILFGELGCASCHALNENGKPVASKRQAKPLEKLRPGTGCVSKMPSADLPNYRLSPRQQAAINSALQKQKQTADGNAIAATLVRFNCYACHERNQIGGPEEARDSFFQTTMQEMGDEGRIPPHLNGVGAKLTRQWLDRVLSNGANDRPYMLTRMPNFGAKNVGHLAMLFEKADRQKPLPQVTFDEPIDTMKKAGWQMVGAKGFACIKCHVFGPYPAEGIQSIDLTLMTQRLRKDWFKRYMQNPTLYRPGTRMPAAWPDGQSLLNSVLEGNAQKQMEAVWLYLSDGRRARTPEGVVVASMELIPFNEAIIYRNFIAGGGPRAIGVGYPEGRHLCFDANRMQLVLLWQGAFIDAKKHWSGRGQGYQPPAGQNIVKLPGEVPFALLDDDKTPWPTQAAKELGYRFRGYRLTKDQRPTFLYSFGEIAIEDFPNPTPEKSTTPLRRRFTLLATKPVANLWYRAASGTKIEAAKDGWYVVDDVWRTRLHGAGKPVLRQSGSRLELLLPLSFANGKVTFEQEILW
ncbi:MAG: hypothetical protein KatS3mg105_4505 [Gemmatales bacterium]|nr:MAG: hypothetical protein KatS3mg105_4505 [Gemmatales bacterium]